jgi:hypothetical protein
MPKIDKESRERIDWFFNFISIDLQQLSMNEIKEVCVDAFMQLKRITGTWLNALYYEEPREELRKNIETEDRRLDLNAVEDLLEGMDIFEFQKQLKEELTPLLEAFIKAKGGEKTDKEILKKSLKVDKVISICDDKLVVQNQTNGNTADTFLTSLMSDLNGIPLSAVKQCQECDNWIFELTARERRFCSARCSSKAAMREKREQLKKQSQED